MLDWVLNTPLQLNDNILDWNFVKLPRKNEICHWRFLELKVGYYKKNKLRGRWCHHLTKEADHAAYIYLLKGNNKNTGWRHSIVFIVAAISEELSQRRI